MNDQELITVLNSGKPDKALKQLYKEFPKIKTNICKTGGNTEIAEEIFTDALMLLMEKVAQSGFELTSKLSTYLYGIARFLWLNQLRKQNKVVELEWSDTLILNEEDLDFDEEQEDQLAQLDKVLSSISERCQDILKRFYYQKQSMQVIAEKLGFTSVNSAKTQKYKCMERAIQLATQLQTAKA